ESREVTDLPHTERQSRSVASARGRSAASTPTTSDIEERQKLICGLLMILEAREVSKVYQMGTTSVAALNEVSVGIGEGEFVAIQGTSGSGKSTLLNVMGGLDHPTKGEVLFDSRALGPLSKKE